MTKTLITLAAAAFVVSAHAGGMDSNVQANGSWPYGAPEALSQSSAVRAMPDMHARMAAAKKDAGGHAAMPTDARSMGANPAAEPSQMIWRYGSTEALSQSSSPRW